MGAELAYYSWMALTALILGAHGIEQLISDSGDDDDGSDPLAGAPLYHGDHYQATGIGTSGADTLVAGDVPTAQAGQGGNDLLTGSAHDDYQWGGEGDDRLQAGAGNDILLGGQGHDSLAGQDGHDSILGDNGNDQLSGGAGNDLLLGGEGADTLSGDEGDDTLSGVFVNAAQEKLLSLRPVVDTLSGGDGNDVLLLGTGDLATGGSGHDSFVLDHPLADGSLGPVVISDYTAGTDRLSIHYTPVKDAQGHEVPPALSVLTHPGSPGVDLQVNGVTVVRLSNINELDPATVRLVPDSAR